VQLKTPAKLLSPSKMYHHKPRFYCNNTTIHASHFSSAIVVPLKSPIHDQDSLGVHERRVYQSLMAVAGVDVSKGNLQISCASLRSSFQDRRIAGVRSLQIFVITSLSHCSYASIIAFSLVQYTSFVQYLTKTLNHPHLFNFRCQPQWFHSVSYSSLYRTFFSSPLCRWDGCAYHFAILYFPFDSTPFSPLARSLWLKHTLSNNHIQSCSQ